MKPTYRILIGILGALCSVAMLGPQAMAGDKADKEAASVREQLRGAIEPFVLHQERELFLQAAGVDGEMDQKEFTQNKRANRPFVRAFDSWSDLSFIDQDADNTIDWFEASAYRQFVRTLLLRHLDQDRNERLNGEEQKKVIPFLASNDFMVALIEKKQIEMGVKTDSTTRVREFGKSVPQATAQEKTIAEVRKDGVITPGEILAIFESQREEHDLRVRGNKAVLMRRFDANGNGKMDPQEVQAYRNHRNKLAGVRINGEGNGVRDAAEQDEFLQSRTGILFARMDRFDENNDGLLDFDEAMIMKIHENLEEGEIGPRQAERELRLRKFVKENRERFDSDGDGHLDIAESNNAFLAYEKGDPPPR